MKQLDFEHRDHYGSRTLHSSTVEITIPAYLQVGASATALFDARLDTVADVARPLPDPCPPVLSV